MILYRSANHCTEQLEDPNDSTGLNLFFNHFYVAEKSCSGKSTESGLPIAKSLMEKMEGTIRAEYDAGMLTIRCEWKKPIV